MFSNQKIKGYVFLFLAFCVCSSKNIIIYNEETLVALSFLTFILFCFHYFGNTIRESLNERGETIKGELQHFLHLKESSLRELSHEHKRMAILKKILPTLGKFTQGKLALLGSSGGQTLNATFSQQVQQKLGQLASSKSILQQRLQKLIANNIEALVLIKIERARESGSGNHLDPQIVRRGIQLLKPQN